MSGIVFINYRRSDAAGMAGRLFDRLEPEFSQDRLFFDVDNIPPGKDFVAYLNEQVAACDVLLAVIGPNWQSQLDKQDLTEAGKQTEDFVRIEIEAALKQGKTVIPVLVSGAELPRKEDLPESLQPFARRNAVRLSHERFKADAAGITHALKAALAEAEEHRAATAQEAARRRAEEERKAKAEREAKEQAEKDKARREAAVAGLSPEQIAKAEELANWDFIKNREDIQKLRDHLARFPKGLCAAMAAEKLETLLWRDLAGAPDIKALSAFLEEFPDGVHAAEAQMQLKELEKAAAEQRKAKEWEEEELAAWDAVKNTSDPKTLAAFLWDWPHSPHKAEAFRLKKALRGRVLTWRRVMVGAGVVAVTAALLATGVSMIGLPRLLMYPLDSSLRTFTGHRGYVASVAFSPDGRTALSGSWDKTIRLWDVATGKELRTFKGPSGPINSVAFAPDGHTALSGSRDGALTLWDVATGELIRTFKGDNDTIRSVALSPDGRTALSGAERESMSASSSCGMWRRES